MSITTLLSADGTRATIRRDSTVPPPPEGLERASAPIALFMSGEVTAVREDVGLMDIVTLFAERGIGAVPVVDERGHPIGIVTKTDVIRVQAGLRRGKHAGEVATRDPRTLPRTAPLWEAAAIMSAHGLHHMMVVDGDGVLIGMLSALDVVRWIAKSEGWGLSRR